MKGIVRIVVLVLIAFSVKAQKESYPKNYFMFPITPGQPNTLAGVLGDLRTNHFHAGLDIRTQQREGLSVHAAADAYVYRVAVQGTGYGNVIYLRHPNGMTTVYGHLQKFSDSLAAYVRQEQYQRKSFYVDLYPAPGQFSFKKGSVIGLSGNTGGSGGPHLHFEIRDSRDNYLNPLYFNFKEIKDVTPPAFKHLALRPTTIDSRVNSRFDRQVFTPVRQKDGTYHIAQPLRGTGDIGIELQAYDHMTGTGFRYGLHCIEIKMDGREIFTYNMEMFPSAVTRDYNNLIDYRTDQETGARFYRCYNPDGNSFDLYKTDTYQGKLHLVDTLRHEVSIKIYDAFENSSVLRFFIQGEPAEPGSRPEGDMPYAGTLTADRDENILKITAPNFRSSSAKATYFVDSKRITKEPSYYQGSTAVFLSDLREYLPDSVAVGSKGLPLHYIKSIPPGREVTFTTDRWGIKFDSLSLFDTLHLAVRHRFNSLTINEPSTPLKYYIQVRYTPEGTIVNRDRTAVYRYAHSNYSFLGGNWTGNQIAFQTRELGTFVVMADTVPPSVRLIEHSKNRIRAYISDDLSGIGDFRAQVNGKWVLLNYEYKSRYLWSEKLNENEPFEGELTLEVTDRAGNSTILQVEIKEPVSKPAPRKRKR